MHRFKFVNPLARGLSVFAVACLFVACTEPAEKVSFKQQVMPILSRHCLICHMQGDSQGGFTLYPDPYHNMVGVASSQSDLLRVAPASSEGSYLYHKLMGTQQALGSANTAARRGVRMPYQREALAANDIAIIRRWIEQGAD